MKIIKKQGINYQNSIFVNFKYSPTVVERIKQIPGRRFIPETKEWEFPADKEEEIRKEFANELSVFDVGEPIDLPPIKVDLKLGEIPKDFFFKCKPYDHQVTAVKYSQTHDKFLLGDEMGTGKTKMSIDISSNKNIEHCLIICGINAVKWNWKNEIEKFSNKTCRFLGQRINKKGKINIGKTQAKIDDLNNFDSIEEFYIITNIETLRNKDIVSKLKELCDNGSIGMIVVDEIHKCTNPQCAQTDGLLQLNTKYKMALTGTPLMNNPVDLYAILKWLNVENGNFWAFKNYYCVFEKKKNKQNKKYNELVGYKNLIELQTKLANVMLRRTKDEVLDLPDKIIIDEYVEMEDQQRTLYENCLAEVLPEIQNSKSLKNALTKMLRLRQITSFANFFDPKSDCAKLDRMEELVEEAIANKRSIIIFTIFKHTADEIGRRLKKYCPSVISGDTNEQDRNTALNNFQMGKTNIIVGTVGTIGTGLNLTRATVEIFIDEPWTEAVKKQCEDRAHRIGQKENVVIYNLLTKDTVDEGVHKILATKKDLSLALVDNFSIINAVTQV